MFWCFSGLLIFLNTSVGGSGPVWSLKRMGQIQTLYRSSSDHGSIMFGLRVKLSLNSCS